MSEMVERVARAIDPTAWRWLDSIVGREPAHPAEAPTRATQVRQARAAIEAMREPTEAMLRASPVVGTGPDERGNWAVNTKPAQAVWPAMIDAALGTSPASPTDPQGQVPGKDQ
jgi:hypothetical protein